MKAFVRLPFWLLVICSLVLSACLEETDPLTEANIIENVKDLEIDPVDVRIVEGGQIQFFGMYGYVNLQGYRYEVVRGPGTINPITGVYNAPSTMDPNDAIAIIRVTDERGKKKETFVFVTTPMVTTPASAVVTVDRKFNFDVVGGAPPISWSVSNPAMGSITSTGMFQANPTTPGSVTVIAEDASGNIAQAVVTIREKPTLIPNGIQVPYGWRLQMQTLEGSPSYTYTMSVLGIDGSIDSNGLLIAPSTSGNLEVRVKDYYDYEATAYLEIIEPNILVSGNSHTCVRFSDLSSIRCWGNAIQGQTGIDKTYMTGQSFDANSLGDEDGEFAVTPSMLFLNGGSFISSLDLVAGDFFSCATVSGRSVRCWGQNDKGQLGDNNLGTNLENSSSVTSVQFSDTSNTLRSDKLVAGSNHVCAYSNADNKFYCWGDNSMGQLGRESATATFAQPRENSAAGDRAFVQIAGATKLLDVKAGNAHTCAIVEEAGTNKMYCWGSNQYGQLGVVYTPAELNSDSFLGDDTGEMTTMKAIDFGLDPDGVAYYPIDLALGANHSCALLNDRSLRCWGDNSEGQLGRGVAVSNATDVGPAIDVGTEQILKIKAGFTKTCVIQLGGLLKCFGDNIAASLGTGVPYGAVMGVSRERTGTDANDMGENLKPVLTGLGNFAIDVSIGETFVCALMNDNRAKCWGNNNSGQLGIESINSVGGSEAEMGDALDAVKVF
jgi:alpha-tubulin suppressor-like RCC1 family protein